MASPGRRAGADLGIAAGWRRIEWTQPSVRTRYTVKVSDDGGSSWQTIAVNQATPLIELDPNQFASTNLQMRVLATNGLEVDTRQFDLDLADE